MTLIPVLLSRGCFDKVISQKAGRILVFKQRENVDLFKILYKSTGLQVNSVICLCCAGCRANPTRLEPLKCLPSPPKLEDPQGIKVSWTEPRKQSFSQAQALHTSALR